MLFLLSPNPPFNIHHRKQTYFTITNNSNHPILFRFKNDQHLLVMPSFGLVQVGECKKVSVINKTGQTDQELLLESIVYVEEQLDMLEYQNPQLWIEKQPGLLETQSQLIRLIVNSEVSSTQQSEQKPTFDEMLQQQPQSMQRSQHTFSKLQEQPLQFLQPVQHRNSIDVQETYNSRTSNAFNGGISPILPQDASRLSGNNFSRVTNEIKQPTFFTEPYDLPPNDEQEVEQEISYQVEPQASGNFHMYEDQISNDNMKSQTSILKPEQNTEVQQMKMKEQQLTRSIEQIKQSKEQIAKELEQLKFKAMFKNKENMKCIYIYILEDQIQVGHLLLVSVICLIMGALLKKVQQIF